MKSPKNSFAGKCYRCGMNCPLGGGRLEAHSGKVRLHCQRCIQARKHLRIIADDENPAPIYTNKQGKMIRSQIKIVGKKRLLKRID